QLTLELPHLPRQRVEAAHTGASSRLQIRIPPTTQLDDRRLGSARGVFVELRLLLHLMMKLQHVDTRAARDARWRPRDIRCGNDRLKVRHPTAHRPADSVLEPLERI